MGRDSAKYKDSIFFADYSTAQEFSEMDKKSNRASLQGSSRSWDEQNRGSENLKEPDNG